VFLRNAWYPAIWSKDLVDRPIGRTFLNEKVVLFRNCNGQVGALQDRCCHRAAPLSKGAIEGEYLRCGYHGLKYKVNGQCVSVPGQRNLPPGAKVNSYPVVEKWNIAWIWMGNPSRTDVSKIPDLPWLVDTHWSTIF
jgi:phenylpropionate dioxygenase-like ring-hydroxylating dioxygenase large terminal subunit